MAGRQADQRLRRSSVRSDDFRGQNTEAPPYPEARTVRRVWRAYRPAKHFLGVDSRSSYRQALTGLSWLSYSRLETYSRSRACRARRPALLPWRLPTPADVERSSCKETNPVDWIRKELKILSHQLFEIAARLA